MTKEINVLGLSALQLLPFTESPTGTYGSSPG